MLLPDEIAALRRADAGDARQWLAVALVSVVAAVAPTLVAVSTSIEPEHLLGRTRAVSATVDAVHTAGHCGRDRDTEYRVHIRWTLDGSRHRGDYRLCAHAPHRGETVRVWIATNGRVHSDSPTTSRLGLAFLSVTLVLFVCGFGARGILPPRRWRRRLLTSRGHLAEPPIPVHLSEGKKVRMHTDVPSHPSLPASRRITVRPVLHRRPGSPATTGVRPGLTGTWWLHLTPHSRSRRRSGLLVRGHERCWIDL